MIQTYASDPFAYDFKSALADARQKVKEREAAADKLHAANERTYMEWFASGSLAPTITHGYGHPTKSVNGKVIPIGEPSGKSLECHRLHHGPECVELPDENRTAKELRADGLSIAEIARVLRITEKAAKTRLAA